MKGKTINLLSLVLLLAAQTSCQENEFGTIDLTMPEEVYVPIQAEYTYEHPCAMFNQTDFNRVKTSLDEETAQRVVRAEFRALQNSKVTGTTF